MPSKGKKGEGGAKHRGGIRPPTYDGGGEKGTKGKEEKTSTGQRTGVTLLSSPGGSQA